MQPMRVRTRSYGGGIAPDIGWHEWQIAPLSVLMGQADDSIATESYGVGSAEYAIVPVAVPTSPITSTLPTTWTAATLDSPGEKLSYWDATFTPTTTGYYRIYSRATDGLGNTETDSDDWFDGAFYVDDGVPTVSISILSASGGASPTVIHLTGVVTDYVGTSFDVDEIYFTIDGTRYEGRWELEAWEADGVTGRPFRVRYENQTGADQLDANIQAFAVDGAGNLGSSAVIVQSIYHDPSPLPPDQTVPLITLLNVDDSQFVNVPPFDTIYTGTITFEGLAWDPDDTVPNEKVTGIDGYQISFDGGLTWDTMARQDNVLINTQILPYDWDIPGDMDATTIQAKIRTTDYAGNSSIRHVKLTFDTGAPRIVGTIDVINGPDLGQHIDEPNPLDFTWVVPTDGSSEVTMLGRFGPGDNDSPPTNVMPTNYRLGEIVGEGEEWYAVVGAEDEVGNVDWMWIGPWYAGQVRGGVPWGGANQSIEFTLDGVIDLTHSEYLTATEWLDTDSRSGSPQSLYNAWASSISFVGWSGADWETDGTLFVYYDLYDGGTTQPISYTGSISLPFAADYAATYDGVNFVKGWAFDGSSWAPSLPGWATSIGYDPETKGLELKMDFGFVTTNLEFADHHRMMAYATDDAGAVWSAFPRNNELSGAFEHFYEWNVSIGTDLLDLPTNAQLSDLAMEVSSDPSAANTLSHGDIVTMSVTLSDLFGNTTSGAQLHFVGSAGVNYQAVAGAMCNDCAAAASWLVDVPSLAANATHTVTLTAQLDADLTGLETVSTTVTLLGAESDNAFELLTHLLDLDLPSAEILRSPGNVIRSTPLNIEGSADDGAGEGVELVEISFDEVSWEPAIGTASWTALITPTTGHDTQLLVYARATDFHGQVSEVVSATLVIDEVAPVITPTVPAVVGGATTFRLTGIASDPEPTFAQVSQVQIQIDGGDWETVNLNVADADGVRDWWYVWTLPSEDGVQHSIRYRAYDYAGNVVTSTTPFTTAVDTVAPVLTVTSYASIVQVGDPSPVLSGTNH